MKKTIYTFSVFCLLVFIGCNTGNDEHESEPAQVKTPVTITMFGKETISENIRLNASSSYLKKNMVKSNSSGYIEKIFVSVGDFVEAGKPLFVIKTKEAEALGKLGVKDSLFGFTGELSIHASASGTVTEINRQFKDYVNDGDQLAVISDESSFVFMMNLPFELNKYASIGTKCIIVLPDAETIDGIVSSRLSSVDPVSQTQSYIVKPGKHPMLPENLQCVVMLNKVTKENVQVIDKSAVLSDETIRFFWVMKLINDSTAVKVQVVKGISGEGKTEIISPLFEPSDRIINSGQYGLPDTAFVTIAN